MSNPEISTVLLNWNRMHLLQQTVESYLSTISVKYEMIIVDNGSTDGSADYIRALCADSRILKAILLDKNMGGEALNEGSQATRGDFIHICENDFLYLDGWDRDLLKKFETFKELGQISPMSPFHQAEKGEIWTDRPAEALEKKGHKIYSALENVTTTCLFRRKLWEKGIRWKSIVSGEVKFPDDGSFSTDVKKMGYMVAWNDQYMVLPLGHNVDEFKANLPYYMENYKAKPWLKLEGFIARLKEHGYILKTRPDGSSYIETEK
jgi:glycosyltransferase involved in cell wall biosynthesis